MSQELCPDVEMGLLEPAVLAAGINQLFKLPQKRPRGQPLSLCLDCVPPSPVGAIALPGRAATLAPVQATDGPATHRRRPAGQLRPPASSAAARCSPSMFQGCFPVGLVGSARQFHSCPPLVPPVLRRPLTIPATIALPPAPTATC